MKNGFYTALGTALDAEGNFLAKGFEKQVEDQVAAGAAGLLVMGSMGIQPYIKNSEYAKVAASGAKAAKGACPVLVGVMDTSIARVMDRIDAVKDLAIQGVVATAPFYYAVSQEEIKEFFKQIADASPLPVYLYDLGGVTQAPFAASTVESLMQHKNIKGIKTGNMTLARVLNRSEHKADDFDVIFSGLDVFDNAYQSGMKKNLDGMFSCTPQTSSKLYKSLEAGDFETAGKCLDDILLLRDTFVQVGVFRGFTYAMNLLGYEGIYSPDYVALDRPEAKEIVRACMQKIGML